MLEEIDAFLAEVGIELGSSPHAQSLREHRAGLFAPLRIAVAGRVKAGKSTLLNALVGERLAPTDAGECTKVVTWYRHGQTYRVTGVENDELGTAPRPLAFDRTDGQLTIDLGGRDPTTFERLEVSWPSDQLTDLTLIDTPGIDSVNRHFSDRTIDLLSNGADDAPMRVRPDAVLYLMTHAHQRDVAMLDSFADQSIGGPGTTNAIGLLSRADEIGGGSRDTMDIAHAVAGQYRSDPRIAARCQTVIPLAGLLAETAVTLREDEFQKLKSIAAVSASQLQLALLSVDRFVSTPGEGMPSPTERIHLLDRFGSYGLRLSCQLIAEGAAPNSSALAAHLRERSGLNQLRANIASVFGHRAHVVRGQVALDALNAAAPSCSPATRRRIAMFVDRLAVNNHEQSELLTLDALRVGEADIAEAIAARAQQVLGAHGQSPDARLGLDPAVSLGAVDRAARDEHAYWAGIERRRELPLATRRLARVALRSCEAMISEAAARH